MTKAKTMPKLTDAERLKRFIEMARELGTSDEPKDFDKAFKRVVPSPKQPSPRRLETRSDGATDHKNGKR